MILTFRSGNMHFDFANAEEFLLDRFLSHKPLVDLEQRTMAYTSSVDAELGVSGGTAASLDVCKIRYTFLNDIFQVSVL